MLSKKLPSPGPPLFSSGSQKTKRFCSKATCRRGLGGSHPLAGFGAAAPNVAPRALWSIFSALALNATSVYSGFPFSTSAPACLPRAHPWEPSLAEPSQMPCLARPRPLRFRRPNRRTRHVARNSPDRGHHAGGGESGGRRRGLKRFTVLKA